MSENNMVKLVDLCTEVSYGYTASANEKKVGPKFLRITDIQGGEVEWGDVPYCEIDEKKLEKNKLTAGDIVVARTGNSTGENYLFDSDEETVFASYLIKFRINQELANPYFVWLHMRTNNWWNYVAGSKSGSAQAGANAKVLGKFEFFLPERHIQDKAAEIILGFNQKLAINRQTNQTLEHMAQAIFKSWFVDFEPTRAKMIAKETGQDPELAAMAAISGKPITELDQLPSEKYQELKTTAALFPDSLVDSELGEIPEEWEVSPLTGVADVIMGQSPKGDTYNDNGIGTPLVNGPVEFGNYHTKRIKWTTAPTRISKDRDLIVCVRGSTTGRLVKSDGEYCLGRGVCAIRSENHQPFVDYLFKSEISKLLSMTTGSTFPSWNGPVLKCHEIVRPNNDLLDAYSFVIEKIELKISNAETEIEQLSYIRNSLLPKLLSGELQPNPINQ